MHVVPRKHLYVVLKKHFLQDFQLILKSTLLPHDSRNIQAILILINFMILIKWNFLTFSRRVKHQCVIGYLNLLIPSLSTSYQGNISSEFSNKIIQKILKKCFLVTDSRVWATNKWNMAQKLPSLKG